MDCKDLMIYDYVKYNGVTKIVDAVYLYSVSVHDPSEEWSISEAKTYSIDDIEPIELTEDILVKNGFEYAYNEASKMQNKQLLVANIGGHYIEVRLDKKNVAIWYDYDENESGFYSDVLLELPRTGHALQHLLRLCGIDKELVID